jgi:DNA invertase Pin-like site-specific DNA recombinase
MLQKRAASEIDELKAAGCTEIFEDVISGASTERAGLDACLDTLNQGDALVVVALDRIGRSTAHVIATVETLGKRRIGFKSLREPVFDTTSPTGQFLLTIFAGLAQLERRMISSSTKSAPPRPPPAPSPGRPRPKHAVHYTRAAAERFEGLWR